MTLEDIRPREDRGPVPKAPCAKVEPVNEHSSGWRHRRKDGTEILVDIASHSVVFEGRSARIVLAMDVTARRSAEAALSESLGILRAVVDDSPLAIIIYAPDLVISRWNKAAAAQFG